MSVFNTCTRITDSRGPCDFSASRPDAPGSSTATQRRRHQCAPGHRQRFGYLRRIEAWGCAGTGPEVTAVLRAAARWARCRGALADLDVPLGITGPDFLKLVAEAVGQRIHLFQAPDLVRTEDRVGEAVRIEGALVVSYDASLRDAPLDNTLFHEGAHILLGHLDDASAGERLQALHSASRGDGQRPTLARSQLPAGVGRGRWELEMERDAETVAQMLMLRRSASPRTTRVAALRLRSA